MPTVVDCFCLFRSRVSLAQCTSMSCSITGFYFGVFEADGPVVLFPSRFYTPFILVFFLSISKSFSRFSLILSLDIIMKFACHRNTKAGDGW